MRKIHRVIYRKTPFPYLLNQSKKWHLPGFEGLPLYDVIMFFRKSIRSQSLTERAAAISYNFIMALPPSLLFLFTIIPHLPFISVKSIKFQLHALIYDIIPAKGHNQSIIAFIDSFLDGARIGLLSFGLLFALFFASNAMMGLMRSFNKKYLGFEERKGLHKRWIAIKLTILIFGLLLAYLILLIMQGALLNLLVKSSDWKQFIFYTRWLLIVLLVFFAIAFIFKYAPAIQKRWKLVSPGAMLTTFLSLLASLGFSAFVNNFGKYNALYGAIGTIMMLMALVFINSLALLIGFELNVSISSLKVIAAEREAEEKAKAMENVRMENG